jgi:hypothetical protein
VRQILWFELFVDFGREDQPPVVGPHGSIFLAVDGKGAAVGGPWMQTYTAGLHEEHMKLYTALIDPCLLAISVIHNDRLALDQPEVIVRL